MFFFYSEPPGVGKINQWLKGYVIGERLVETHWESEN
jgi:hypothetical protein